MPRLERAVAIFLVCLLTAALPAIAEDLKPSGTVVIDDTQFGFIINGDVGHGTLTYNGQEKLFHVHGGKLGGMGISGMTLVGDVYRLEQLKDFEGTYLELEAGLTIGEGKGGIWLKNEHGVSLHLKVKESKGLALSIGAEGLKISF